MKNIIYGIHAVQSTLENNAAQIKVLFVQQGREDKRLQKILTLAKKNDISVQHADKKTLEKMVAQHQGVVAEVVAQQLQQRYHENDLLKLVDAIEGAKLILVLDGVTDPHNLGAILRTADAAGVHLVISPKDRAVGITPVVCKVAAGAAETVPFIQVTNLARTMQQLQELGVWFYGTDDQAVQSLYQHDLTGNIALVMGAEGEGMRRLTREHCDYLVSLPMAGQVSSLNVSVATGVCLFEIMRQKKL